MKFRIDQKEKQLLNALEEKYHYSIELYLGEKRSGKTLSMVAETFRNIKKDPSYKVYANFHLNPKYFPDAQFIGKKDLEEFYQNKTEFKHAIFLIDETHVFMDSRLFARKGNLAIGYFLGQMGKRDNIFRGSTHFPHLVDFRLRSYCEKWNYCRKGFLQRNEFKPMKNNNIKLTKEQNENLIIQIRPIIRKLIDFDFFNINEKPIYVKAADFFNYYDTEELIYSE